MTSFNRHSLPPGAHAILSPSSYHWVNYDEDKLTRVYHEKMQSQRGTDLHNFAHEAIRLGVRQVASKRTLNQYINDGIGYKMSCEVMLKYSMHCFGHADCIAFKNNILRIHDLKTGVTPASMMQLRIYAALFCLEYDFDPRDIEIELRIYQNDTIDVENPEWTTTLEIMNKIKTHSRRLDYLMELEV